MAKLTFPANPTCVAFCFGRLQALRPRASHTLESKRPIIYSTLVSLHQPREVQHGRLHGKHVPPRPRNYRPYFPRPRRLHQTLDASGLRKWIPSARSHSYVYINYGACFTTTAKHTNPQSSQLVTFHPSIEQADHGRQHRITRHRLGKHERFPRHQGAL